MTLYLVGESPCIDCKRTLPHEQFPANKRTKEGLRQGRKPYCLDCQAQRTARYQKDSRERIKSVRDAAKDMPCMDCGVKYPPYVMQFDHVRGTKEFTISTFRHSRDMTKLYAEIEKCDVVCANCHFERTHQRRISALAAVPDDLVGKKADFSVLRQQ